MQKKENLFNLIVNWFEDEENQQKNFSQAKEIQTRTSQSQDPKLTNPPTLKNQTIESKAQPFPLAIQAQRTIFIRYQKPGGKILAILEILQGSEGNNETPWSSTPVGTDTQTFDLNDELADKPIIEIHRDYKVTKSGDGVELTLKS